MRKRTWVAGVSGAAIGGWLALRWKSLTKKAGRYVGHAAGRTKVLAYRVVGRHPEAAVDDSILADRIRSTLDPLEQQLQAPRINVTVENGVAILHGDIESPAATTQIEEAVRGVAGVRGIRSHLSH